jgi:neural Wiskott-Aldrich syndrome protein
MSVEPPPLYTQDASDSGLSSDDDGFSEHNDPQIIIIPPSLSAQFQKGFLGADDEHAAIEGELQIKGISASACRKVYVPSLALSCRSPKIIQSLNIKDP